MKRTCFIVLSMIGLSSAVIYRLNDTQHDLMPAIVHLDPYERCMHKPGALYCTVHVNFVSDEPSALLTQMQEYSEYTTRHFNYTRAIYGTCVSEKCILEKDTDPKRTLEACLNRTVWNDYKLRVKLENDLYCLDGNNRKQTMDIAGIAVLAICLILVILNAVASLYDFYFSEKKQSPVAYLLICFSLRRNWRGLVASSDNSKDPRDRRLQGIHGIRAILMILVVNTHAMLYAIWVTDNPSFYEKHYDILPFHILMNGSLIMQTFLIMSAFLLVYNSLKVEEKHEISWTSLPLKIFKRWMRLTPSYALVLGVTATLLNYVGNGPLWSLLVTAETRDCRRDWWRYLLYINNYFDTSKCMPQAWYLAVDFQLYCLGMIVYVFCKRPTSRNVVLSILFFAGIVFSGLHTYFQDLDATLLFRPNSVAEGFLNDPTYIHVYRRSHTNISSYMLGMALGYLIYKLQQNEFDNNYKKWRPVYWAMLPVSFGIFLLCKFFYVEGPRVDVCWRAVTASVIRPAYGLAIAIVLGGMILKIENVYRSILEWRGWTTMARVSYSAYLLNFAFVRTLGGVQATNVPGTYLGLIQTVLLISVATYLAAYVFYLTVEAPSNQLVKLCLEPRTRRKTDNETVETPSKL